MLSRLEGVKRSGKGWIARCPAHADRSPSLSIAEGSNDTVLLHCFGGCEPASVLAAIGMELADLFPTRDMRNLTPAEQSGMRQASRHAGWAAALGVLQREATVLQVAATMMVSGTGLGADGMARLVLASQRIDAASAVLR